MHHDSLHLSLKIIIKCFLNLFYSFVPENKTKTMHYFNIYCIQISSNEASFIFGNNKFNNSNYCLISIRSLNN